MLDMLWHILKYRNRVNYVLIDTYSTLSFWYAYFGSKLCQIFKIKFIPILHGGQLEKRLKKNPRAVKSIFDKAYVNIAPSKFMYSRFKHYGFENIIVIPNSFELSIYPFENRKIVRPKLLWVRSLAQIYNPKMALEVLKIIKNVYPEACLTMVGPEKDITSEQILQWAKELGVEVTLTGQLSKSQWIQLSENFDIFINTTNIDNTPVSVMEAMALGLPVVSTNVGGVPFLIEHKKEGLLVPPNDPKFMASTIFELLEKPDLVENLTINARSKVETFDWKIVKNQWVELLK